MLDSTFLRVARRTMRALDTPRSLTVDLLIRYEEWEQLTSLKVNSVAYEPLYHQGVERLRRDTLATELLRKNGDIELGVDLHAAAVASLYETEKQCKATNDRLDRHLLNPVFETELERAADVLFARARRWIAKTLGPVPETLNGSFGPGATFESCKWKHRRLLTAYDKLRNLPSRASNMPSWMENHLVWETVFGEAWGSRCPNRRIPSTRYSRFSSVRKDATKNRGIGVEPGLNVLGQKALGGEMRNRLKRVGLDLVKGQDLHRALARTASIDGESATVDLSNASNTVAFNLVRLLLPVDWFDLLASLRTPFIEVEGKILRLEMFSSMGNGYTFELETLIFASLVHALGGGIGSDSFVYGDDIIVPTAIVADVLALLQYAGFTPNEKKTFTTGCFRESCGGDYFHGHDVRAFYTEENPYDPATWITLANAYWRWSIKWSMPELAAVRNSCLDNIPTEIRHTCRGPEALGDLVIQDIQHNWNCRIRGSVRWFRVWRPVTRKLFLFRARGTVVKQPTYKGPRTVATFSEKHVALAAALLGLPSDGLAPRDGVQGFRFGRVAYS